MTQLAALIIATPMLCLFSENAVVALCGVAYCVFAVWMIKNTKTAKKAARRLLKSIILLNPEINKI